MTMMLMIMLLITTVRVINSVQISARSKLRFTGEQTGPHIVLWTEARCRYR